jgi:thiosulfate dehydrogenase
MRKNIDNWLLIGALIVIFSLAITGCASPTTEPTEEPAAVEPSEEDEHTEDEHAEALEGDVVRGGLLYDKWWAVEASDEHEHDDHEGSAGAPDGDQPLWATQSTNERSGSDTWRCKECHGWDYKGADGAYSSGSHFTGFVGVIQLAGSNPNEVLAAMKGETNPDHDFSSMMDEQDLVDLSIFISEALIDMDGLVNEDKSAKGDSAAGETLYGEVCTLCHGPEGNAINFHGIDDPEFLGHLAPGNPWEFIHKVRFGQPGWPMPSSIGNDWSDQDVADVLAYAQSFPEEPAVSGGGQLYDKWWVVLELDEPADDQPLWATQSTNERSGTDTWRCKECHGWDYLGAEGAYGDGSHFTGFTGVLGAATLSAEELTAWLDGSTNPDHDFSVMEEIGINAMLAFLQSEMADISAFVNDDKSVNGDPVNGEDLWEGTCTTCHGVDGTKINFHDADDPEYVGTVAAGNPWEFFHKVLFGQPGAPMPSGMALGWGLEEIADLLAYAQTLPTE